MFAQSTLSITALLFLASVAANPLCKPPTPNLSSEQLCANPPTFPIDPELYTGTWFTIYTSGSAIQFGDQPCTTANYTLQSNGSISVLNCFFNPSFTLPKCLPGVADPKPGADNSGKLIVSFPSVPMSDSNPGHYNVATILRDHKGKYIAAAVFGCSEEGGQFEPGFFILSRSRFFAPVILALLKKKLTFLGYDTNVEFLRLRTTNCRFFFDEGGFEILEPFET